ncbi:hypothetical protein JTB14_021363 [Gonioctena quinquepunctata]|nr:hypothetical protein JTB14_021363 [Gonioctena quinquepunctata]
MRTSLSRTGCGLDDVKSLSELDLKILDLPGENFVGLNNPECGVPVGVTVSHKHDVCENVLEEPSISNTMPQKENMEPPPKRQKMNFHNEYKEIIEELRDIKNTINSSLSEISSNLKDVATEIKTMNNYLPQVTNEII